MTDDIIVKREPQEIHPEGQFGALCVDIIALGMRVQDFQGHESASEACAFIFTTLEKNTKGYAFTIQTEMNVSTSAKSKLLKFLERWNGRTFTSEELGSGFKLSEYIGKPALISLVRKISKLGNPRVEIDTIMPLPKGMPAPLRGDYRRAEFWERKKEEYAAAYSRFMSRTMRGEPLGVEEDLEDRPSG